MSPNNVVEILNIDGGKFIPHEVISIIGDGACLFRALSFSIFNTQENAFDVRRRIVTFVTDKWIEYGYMSHDKDGNNYDSVESYKADMLRPRTYGGLCELVAAAELYPFVFEVYRNRQLYFRAGSGDKPVKRLKFSSDLSDGHFDVYSPEVLNDGKSLEYTSTEDSVNRNCSLGDIATIRYDTKSTKKNRRKKNKK